MNHKQDLGRTISQLITFFSLRALIQKYLCRERGRFSVCLLILNVLLIASSMQIYGIHSKERVFLKTVSFSGFFNLCIPNSSHVLSA